MVGMATGVTCSVTRTARARSVTLMATVLMAVQISSCLGSSATRHVPMLYPTVLSVKWSAGNLNAMILVP